MERLSRQQNKHDSGHEQGACKVHTVQITWPKQCTVTTETKWVNF